MTTIAIVLIFGLAIATVTAYILVWAKGMRNRTGDPAKSRTLPINKNTLLTKKTAIAIGILTASVIDTLFVWAAWSVGSEDTAARAIGSCLLVAIYVAVAVPSFAIVVQCMGRPWRLGQSFVLWGASMAHGIIVAGLGWAQFLADVTFFPGA